MVAVICSFSCRLGSVTVNPFHVSTNEPRDTRAAEDFPKVKVFDRFLDALLAILPNVKGEEAASSSSSSSSSLQSIADANGSEGALKGIPDASEYDGDGAGAANNAPAGGGDGNGAGAPNVAPALLPIVAPSPP